MANRRQLLSHLLVILQLAGIALCLFPVDLANRGRALSLLLCALGAAVGLYALAHNRIGMSGIYPELPPDAQLITSGPYRFVRHPMYTSLLLMMLGIALYNLHPINLTGFGIIALAVLGKVRIEERALRRRFPEYETYAARTAALVPFVR